MFKCSVSLFLWCLLKVYLFVHSASRIIFIQLAACNHDRIKDLNRKKGMDIPAVHLLLLEQEDHSLEDHTREFLDLPCLTQYQDRSLCSFISHQPQQVVQGMPAHGRS